MKKMITFLLVISMAFSVIGVSFAKETYARAMLDEALKDTSGWSKSDGALVFEKGGLSDVAKDDIKDVFGYQNRKFKDEIIDFDAVFNFVDVTNWQGIMIRAKSTENVPWKDNEAYLIVITENQIELQRFSYRSDYLAVVPTPFEGGERVNVQFGAKNIDEGVELIVKINGETIISVVDTDEAAIKSEGYFAVYNSSDLKIMPSSRKDKAEAPCVYMPTVTTGGIVGDDVAVEYKFVSHDEETEGESEFTWYRAFTDISVYGKKTLVPEDFKNRYLEKIKTTSTPVYTLTEQDVGKFLLCGVKVKSEQSGVFSNEVLSNAVYIDTLQNTLGQGIFFANNCQYAINKGKREIIDNIETAPFAINENMFFPLRYVAESFGYKVEWNNENNSAVCTLDEKAITVINDGKNIINKNGRLYIPGERVYELFGVKTDYKPILGLGIISNQNIGLDELSYRFFLRNLLEKVIGE